MKAKTTGELQNLKENGILHKTETVWKLTIPVTGCSSPRRLPLLVDIRIHLFHSEHTRAASPPLESEFTLLAAYKDNATQTENNLAIVHW